MTDQVTTAGQTSSNNKAARRTRRQLLAGGTGVLAAALTAEAFIRPAAALAVGPVNITAITPSGDTTGATDTTAVVNALAGNNTVLLADGHFYIRANQVLLSPGQSLIHLGEKTSCRVFQVGATIGFTIGATNSTGNYQQNSFVTFGGITTDGTMAAVPQQGQMGATGWQIGDIAQVYLNDCDAHGFTSGIGWRFVNQYFWTEQIHGFIHVSSSQDLIAFDCVPASSTATGSFERMDLACWINQGCPSFNVMTFQNGAFCGNGSLRIYGNCSSNPCAGSATAGSVLTITGKSPNGLHSPSNLQHMELTIGVEVAPPPSATPPIVPVYPNTITLGTDGNYISQCHGLIDFGMFKPFAPAQLPANSSFDFVGPIRGDDTLLVAQWRSFSSGLPSGWSGRVRFKPRWEAGLITVKLELTIDSGTVMTQGEIILSGLPAVFTPISNESFPAMLYDPNPSNPPSVNLHPVTITSDGALQINQTHTMFAKGSLTITHTYANSI